MAKEITSSKMTPNDADKCALRVELCSSDTEMSSYQSTTTQRVQENDRLLQVASKACEEKVDLEYCRISQKGGKRPCKRKLLLVILAIISFLALAVCTAVLYFLDREHYNGKSGENSSFEHHQGLGMSSPVPLYEHRTKNVTEVSGTKLWLPRGSDSESRERQFTTTTQTGSSDEPVTTVSPYYLTKSLYSFITSESAHLPSWDVSSTSSEQRRSFQFATRPSGEWSGFGRPVAASSGLSSKATLFRKPNHELDELSDTDLASSGDFSGDSEDAENHSDDEDFVFETPAPNPTAGESFVRWSREIDFPCGGIGDIPNLDPQDNYDHRSETSVHRVKRIVNGRRTRPGEIPWIAMIVQDGDHAFCGGSILDSRHILTAAHCLIGEVTYGGWTVTYEMNPKELKVIVGKHKRDVTRRPAHDLEQHVRVSKVIRHPRHKVSSNDNDIAILVLKDELVASQWVRHVCLPSPDDVIPAAATVAGWGHTQRRNGIYGQLSPVYHDELLKARLSVYLSKDCRRKFKHTRPNMFDTVTDGMMCALDTTRRGQDTCPGDSGGPLYAVPVGGQSYVQFGVVSWGYGCGVPGEPGYYAYVPYYLGWIRDVLSKT